jgi:hypothetical protein
MSRIGFGLLALVAAAPAAQAQTPALWENVQPGMSVQQVRALYPAGDKVRHRAERTTINGHTISGDCRADVHILHRRGSVDGVVLRGEPAIFARCGAAVLDGLTARLGAPASTESGRPSILKRERTTYVWNANGVYLRFVSFSTEGWGGAGLGNASWEMSFSTRPEAPTL